jgi:hypothetical protein
MIINTLFYFDIVLFFFLDIILYGFLEKKIFHFLLCFYTFFIFRVSSPLQTFFLIFLLTLEGLLEISFYGTTLLYLLPITIFVHMIRSQLQPYSVIPLHIIFMLFYLFNYLLKSFFTSGGIQLGYYIYYELCANIVVLSIFLKLFKGRRDNRF